ncbi:MAG: hypothetical protein Q7J44_13335 [Pseudotabrizicola sp.]|uniref:hypothetical protein n=1 Tax=Pseudotabrizicola sp. TaxID=2939647 RepID=UPI00271EDFCB|nr:hypothetical protein [Pseudotabrizicola sp.]MDO9639515.1 hypothetical protein [Pseudotabrizicola sp.]
MSIWERCNWQGRGLPASAAAVALSLALGLPATAQDVADCDWRGAAQAIAEPWEDNTATFANGAVRLAVMDVMEPAAAAYHLLILSPPHAELGERQCRVMSAQGSFGFAGLSVLGATATYDPATGLTVTLPAKRWSDGDVFTDTALHVTINQATGAITGRLD